MDQAQYGLGDVDDHGRELVTGEQREIDRIENQSIPQLRKLLDDLKTQLEQQLDNPMVKYGLTSAADRGEVAGARSNLDPNGYPVEFKSKERELYKDNYFRNDVAYVELTQDRQAELEDLGKRRVRFQESLVDTERN